MKKQMKSIVLAGVLSASMLVTVGCSNSEVSNVEIQSTEVVEEPKTVIALNDIDTVVTRSESSIEITNIKLIKDDYDYDTLEVTYNFTNLEAMTTSASTVIHWSAKQGGSICPYPVLTKYTEHEKELVKTNETKEDCKVYFRLNKVVNKGEDVELVVEEYFSNDKSKTAFKIDLNNMSIERVAN